MDVIALKEKVLKGYNINEDEAKELYNADINLLKEAANEIRKFFMQDNFDLCTIVNAKCGSCSENCKFCAQSAHHGKNVETYPLLDDRTLIDDAKKQKEKGILRYSIVTSGKKLSDEDVLNEARIIKKLKEECDIEICISNGLLSYDNFKILKEAGASRVHNNLEAAPSFFPSICTTHTIEDKIQALEDARRAGLEVCSGGIIGLGESREQRIEMAMTLRDLNVKSIPVNVLNPIPNTPFGDNEKLSEEEVIRTVAVYRFILKDSFIRLAGGRSSFDDKGKAIFESGANAAISGDMLTTSGINTKSDLEILKELNFTPRVVSIL